MYSFRNITKDKKKDGKSVRGANSKKKDIAPAVDSSRSVTSTRSRVDEDSGSGEPTSGTPDQASADPVSASPAATDR